MNVNIVDRLSLDCAFGKFRANDELQIDLIKTCRKHIMKQMFKHLQDKDHVDEGEIGSRFSLGLLVSSCPKIRVNSLIIMPSLSADCNILYKQF